MEEEEGGWGVVADEFDIYTEPGFILLMLIMMMMLVKRHHKPTTEISIARQQQ